MPSTALREQMMANVRSVVVKVGTALLTDDTGQLDRSRISSIARQLATLHERGIRITLVSSGAVGAGMARTGLRGRPRSLPMLQATAAIGQPALMSLYEKTLAKHGLHVGQVLVTRANFEHRPSYVNISNTLASLHRLRAIPVINENDTVAVDEFEHFADNDTIAALVTNLLRADLLILLTVVDGLLDAQGQLVDLVPSVTGEVQSLARQSKSALGSGGMQAKLAAARLVTDAGEGVIIANGREPNVLIKLLDGQRVGTIFTPAARKLSARQRWIVGAVRPAGTVVIDAGAAAAIHAQGKSLLARGITRAQGNFPRNAIVRVVDETGRTIAHAVSNYSATELKKIKGLKSDEIANVLGTRPFDEAIHRDNLVLTVGQD